MKIPRLILLTFFVWISVITVAQTDPGDVFDDGGLSLVKNLVKAGFDPVNGEFPLVLERKLGKYVSLEMGAGLISCRWQQFLYERHPLPDIPDGGVGFTGWANFRFYKSGFFEQYYLGMMKPRFSVMGEKWFGEMVFAEVGYQRTLAGNLVMDLSIGSGVRFFKDLEYPGFSGDETWDSRYFLPILLKVGYAF